MENLINLGYMVAVILLTTLVLTYIVKHRKYKQQSDKVRILTTLICGLVLSPVWYFMLQSDIGQLIISLLAAMTFYGIIKKFIWNGFERMYNNGKGKI